MTVTWADQGVSDFMQYGVMHLGPIVVQEQVTTQTNGFGVIGTRTQPGVGTGKAQLPIAQVVLVHQGATDRESIMWRGRVGFVDLVHGRAYT